MLTIETSEIVYNIRQNTTGLTVDDLMVTPYAAYAICESPGPRWIVASVSEWIEAHISANSTKNFWGKIACKPHFWCITGRWGWMLRWDSARKF